MKYLVFILLFTSLSAYNELKEAQEIGLTIVEHNKTITIKKEKNSKCKNVTVTPSDVFGGEYANKDVPKECKKSFVTMLGVVQPMQLFNGIKTVGELEILEHIKNAMKEPKKYVLIDARTPQWYHQMTIPTAVNLPFNQINDFVELDEDEEKYKHRLDEVDDMVDIFGIIHRKTFLDFSRCKSAVIFCNGSWCSQSPKMIMKLINLGYPREKLLWYRGGMQDWVINGFTVTKD